MSELRKLEKKTGGHWVESSMKELVPGDVFRMFEPTGEAVVWKGTEWKVIGDPYRVVNEKGVHTWGVDVEEILEG
jgi:hypothetical protein